MYVYVNMLGVHKVKILPYVIFILSQSRPMIIKTFGS